jgi:predicted dehydrogenase
MGPVRLGLIGCGRIASRVHLRVLRGLADGHLAAIAEPDADRRTEAARAAPGASLFEDHVGLLASEVDAVVICTPPATHAALAAAALEAGKHIYVEKPLSHRLEEAERLAALAEESDRVAAVGLNFRLHPLLVEAKRRLKEGRIGRLTAVRTLFTSRARALPDWKRRRQTGGGVLLDLFSHHADIVPFLLEQPVEQVAAELRSIRTEDDTASVMLRMADGTLVQSLVSMAGIEADRIELIADDGGLLWDRHWRRNLIDLDASRASGGLGRLRSAMSGVRAAVAVMRDAALPPVEESFRLALEAWLHSIREGSPAPVPLRAGLDSLRIVDWAEHAAREGRWVPPRAPAASAAAAAVSA